MVTGLDLFRNHFIDFSDRFIIIGGTACDLVFQQAGLPFRATRDLDLVLCVESLDVGFVNRWWAFIKAGQYKIQTSSSGKKRFYRFQKPDQHDYPYMLELFSRKPNALTLSGESHLTPLPMEATVSSLSAILLDEDYYHFILEGRIVLFQLPVIGPDRLIPLKMRAWLDLVARKSHGENIDEKIIKKHRNDVFRLFMILDQSSVISTHSKIRMDIKEFINRVREEEVDINVLGLRTLTIENVLSIISRLYDVS